MIKKIIVFMLAATSVAPATAFAQRTGTVTGRVTDADTGNRIAAVIVCVERSGTKCVTDTAGRFAIAAEVGDTIRFTAWEYPLASHTVSKTGNHDIGDVVFKNTRSKLRPVAITGRVTSADTGKPMPGGIVSVRSIKIGLDSIYLYRIDSWKEFLTDSAGRFGISAAAGDTLKFTFKGYKEVSHIISKSIEDDTSDIELKKVLTADEDTAAVLITMRSKRKRAIVTGYVMDAGGGKPLPGVTVSSPCKGPAPFSDSEGYFITSAEVGDTIRFSYFGYKPETYIVSKSENHDIGRIKLKKEDISKQIFHIQ